MGFIADWFSQDTPEPYNPVAASSAQGAANEDAARLSQRLNLIDSYGPTGSAVYTEGDNDRWRLDQTLNPAAQSMFDQQQKIGTGMLDSAYAAMGQLPTSGFTLDGAPGYQTGIDYSGLQAIPGQGDFETSRLAAEEAAFNRVMGRINPQFNLQQEALETQLANQGIGRGTEAYTRAFDEFSRRRNDANIAAGYDAISAGEAMRQGLFANALTARGQQLGERTFDMNAINEARQNYLNEQLTQRNQNINELAALLQGSPAIAGPTPAGGRSINVQPANVQGAYGLAAQQQQNSYAQRMAQQNNLLGGLANLGGTALMANAMS